MASNPAMSNTAADPPDTISEAHVGPEMTESIRGPDWKLVGHAEWQPRDSCVELVFRDHLWIMGGWFQQDLPNPRDVWKSADGIHWERVIEQAPWEKSDLPMGLVFEDRMWHMGGRSLPGTECSHEVWASADGADWELITANAGWSPRLGSAGIVFDGRMWLFGGTASFYESNADTLHNDIWSSADGKDWTCHLEHAPWTPRAYAKVVALDGKLWLIGGGQWGDSPLSRNDVWCSENGVDWECVCESAPWLPRIWHGCVVYRDHLWVIAGDHLGDPAMLNDVWFSPDGRDWCRLESDVVFSPRHEISPYVFRDKLWVTAGHAMPLSNEIWTLALPRQARWQR